MCNSFWVIRLIVVAMVQMHLSSAEAERDGVPLHPIKPINVAFSDWHSLLTVGRGTNDLAELKDFGIFGKPVVLDKSLVVKGRRILCHGEGRESYTSPFYEKASIDFKKLQSVRSPHDLSVTLGEPQTRIGPWGHDGVLLWGWALCNSATNGVQNFFHIAAVIDWNTDTVRFVGVVTSTNSPSLF
jgi:hypothetical protein